MFRCTVLFVVAALAASAQPSDKGQVLEAIFSDYEVIQLDPGEVERQVKQYREPLTVEIAGTRFVFELEPRDLRSPRYRAEATGDDGLRRPIQDPEVSTFKGTAVGAPDIQGRFTITKDSFDGVIFTPGDWLYIEPVKNYHPDSEDSESGGLPALGYHPRRSVELRDVLFTPLPGTGCRQDRASRTTCDRLLNHVHRGSGDGRRYRVCTGIRRWACGQPQIMSILNRVEGVYERELRLKIEVTYQHVWENEQGSLQQNGHE